MQLPLNDYFRFTDLLPHLLLTMSLSTPINWMVASTHSPYDLDNIRLNDVELGTRRMTAPLGGKGLTLLILIYFFLLIASRSFEIEAAFRGWGG